MYVDAWEEALLLYLSMMVSGEKELYCAEAEACFKDIMGLTGGKLLQSLISPNKQ